MKFELVVDPAAEERVVMYTKENNPLAEEIRRLVETCQEGLVGYKEKEIVSLNPLEILCVTVMDSRVYAVCREETFLLKERLYVLEERLPDCFVKINQSCIANLRQIQRFDASVSGTLKVRFKNGYVDYVSRRQLRLVKERLGI